MKEMKRQNFNVDAGEAAELELARSYLGAPTVKDAMLRAARFVNAIASELKSGKKLMASDEAGNSVRIMLPDLEQRPGEWLYLCARPHPWRKQLYVKGRKLLASSVWNDMVANQMTIEEAAADRDLPISAVREAIKYCEQNMDLIRMEADEERQRLLDSGVNLGSAATA